MLRVYPSKSSKRAKDYFSNELTKGDYYTEGQEIAGVWGGRVAEWLGLEGTVNQDDFNALIDNQFPETTPMAGEQITERNAINRRVGYDLNFHMPKAGSILYEYSQDERILDAFRDAVHYAMAAVQEDTFVRVRKDGANDERRTANLAYAEFVHFTARPVDDKSDPDPHLHAHCFVPNVSYDPVEDQWKAGEFGHIKEDAPYYEALFHSHLTKSLSDLGLDITREGNFWTFENLDRDTVDKFKQRTDQVEAKAAELDLKEKAKELGIDVNVLKDQLGASTRASKQEGKSRDELRSSWWNRLEEHEIQALEELSDFEAVEDTNPPNFTAEETVEFAIKHKLEKQSVCSLKRLKETALRRGFGEVSPDEVEQAFQQNDELLAVGNQATTQEILNQENQIVQFTKQGYAKYDKLNPDYNIGLVTDYTKEEQFELDPEQKEAVQTMLTSRHRVQAFEGKAGTGKTTTIASLIDGIEQGGGHATVLAPTADAAYNTLRKDGEAYHCEPMENASTLARYFVDERLWKEAHGSTLIVDEAGLMSVDDMHTLFSLANQHNNRVILVGDTSQHNSVMRGDAYRILQDEAGIEPAQLESIRRQSGGYREAVHAVSQGNLIAGYNKLDDLGMITIETDDDKRYQSLANQYADVLKSKQTALTVAPTHAEGELVSDYIRNTLKDRGMVGKDDHTLTRFKNLNFSEAERSDSFNFESGQMVRFQQNAKGEFGRINRSDEFTVSQVDKTGVWITNESGQEQPLDLSQPNKFSVYQPEAIQLASGDRIRITEGHKTKDGQRLNNGSIYEVKGITEDGNLQLKNGYVVDGSKGNFNQGYVTTSIASQGKTVNHVFIAQSTDYAGAASAEQFYVSVSRGKQSVNVFTDDKEELRNQIQRSHQRTSAIELQKKGESLHDESTKKSHLVASLEYYANQLLQHLKDTADDFLSTFRRSEPEPDKSKWQEYIVEREQQKQMEKAQSDKEMTL